MRILDLELRGAAICSQNQCLYASRVLYLRFVCLRLGTARTPFRSEGGHAEELNQQAGHAATTTPAAPFAC